MSPQAENICQFLSKNKLPLHDEKETQVALEALFEKKSGGVWIDVPEREFRLDDKNIIDFYFQWDGIGVEVKLRGSAKDIYRQCERYCGFLEIKELILVTNKTMQLPEKINGKPCTIIRPSRAWL